MNRNKIKSILTVLDARLCDLNREDLIGAAQRQEVVGSCRVLRREVEDDLNRKSHLEVFGHGGAAFLLNGAKILAIADVGISEYVVLLQWNEVNEKHKFVTARVFVHDDTGRDITGWDIGHYFEGGFIGDDLNAARKDFIARAFPETV